MARHRVLYIKTCWANSIQATERLVETLHIGHAAVRHVLADARWKLGVWLGTKTGYEAMPGTSAGVSRSG